MDNPRIIDPCKTNEQLSIETIELLSDYLATPLQKLASIKRQKVFRSARDGSVYNISITTRPKRAFGKTRYWYSISKSTLDQLREYDNSNLVFCCNSSRLLVIIPQVYIDTYIDEDRLSASATEDDGVRQWHIELFFDDYNNMSLQLYNPTAQININEFVVNLL